MFLRLTNQGFMRFFLISLILVDLKNMSYYFPMYVKVYMDNLYDINI